LRKTGEEYWAGQVTIQAQEAAAWLAFVEHRNSDAVRMLELAANHEDDAEKHAVTPGTILPARELLGDLLMELRQPKAALTEYKKVLAAAPGRRNAAKGAAEAERLSAMSSKIKEIDGVHLPSSQRGKMLRTLLVERAGR